ncbi:MAG TPA: hypothetical protein PLT45_08635 [Smithella sp.]|nr:hypothetical protein [Smithella sp.]
MINNAIIFVAVALILTAVSYLLDREKTKAGLKKGLQMFKGIAVPFLNILILVSLVLYFVPPDFIAKYLGRNSGIWGFVIPAVIGSITLIPGFISYPIAAVLIRQGASYTTVATFMTTLMMVGIVTLPLEAKYFGFRVAVIRNTLNFFAAIVIGLLVGLCY